MSEGKDPAIKLFGRTIQLPEIPPPPPPDTADSSCTDAPPPPPPMSEDRSSYSSSSSSSEEDESNSKHVVAGNEQQSDKNTQEEKFIHEEENRAQSLMSEELTDPSATSLLNDNSKTPSVDSESPTAKTTKTEEEQSETSNSQDKTLKKPDKILPCPRCNSMDTKFCYYNNYNVNQPRHFCKNCQRYWTAGGNMRNVPVGAGRRKNKASASHYHQITVTEALQNTRADLPNGLHHPILKANGTVLTFGSDSTPLCESMTTVLKIAEKTMRQNGLIKPEVSGNGDDHSSGSSVTDGQNCQNGFPPQVPCFPGAPWPFPWAPQMGPAFVPPGYPMPFYPAPPYWGCAVPGPWNVPWVTPPTNYHAAPSSPTLGKHSRDDENMAKSSDFREDQTQKENEPEKSLWIPKTLRIDDPGEAAKSSIWATLGIKNDRSDAGNEGGIFKAFRSRREGKNHISEASPVLQANPAALSRSANFQESS